MIDFGGHLLIGMAWTIDVRDCLLFGIVRTIVLEPVYLFEWSELLIAEIGTV